MNAADVDGNGTIDCQEFLGATMHLNKLNRDEYLLKAFRHFDTDDSGYITHDKLIRGLKGTDPMDLKTLMNEVDKDKVMRPLSHRLLRNRHGCRTVVLTTRNSVL